MKSINLATWNLNYGIGISDILTTIKTNTSFVNLDFLVLQEASLHNGKEDAEIIAKLLGQNYTYFQVTAQTFRGIPQANALIWNTKNSIISTFDVLEMPPFHLDSRLHQPYKRIFQKEHKVAIFLQSIFQHRISLVVEGKIYGKTFRLYVVHFDIIGLASKKRQMTFILDDAKKRKKVDIQIIAGDLNTFKVFRFRPWNSIIKHAENEGFLDITTEIPWTYSDRRFPKKYPSRHKVDAILIRSKEKTNYQSWALDVVGSDHIPVFANIELP